MAKKKLTVAEANRAYFMVLADTRGSLGTLSVLAIVSAFILGIGSIGPLNASNFPGYEFFSHLDNAHLMIIWMCAGFVLLSMFKKLTYRFQVFFTAAMAVMAAGSVYAMCLMAATIAAIPHTRDIHLFVVLFTIFGLIAVVLVAGSIVVHVLLLRHRLRVGHSEARTIGNIVAVSRANRSKTFWIILAVVAVVPNVVTFGQYLGNSLGVIGLIVFVCVTPSLPVEFAYLAYLKSKDRAYWEARPAPRSKRERLRIAKKAGWWVFGIVAGIALIRVLGIVLPLWLA